MASEQKPRRGEIWYVDFAPVRGHEQDKRRPALVISHDRLNASKAGLAVVIPLSRTAPRIPLHVPLKASESGLQVDSTIQCDHVRTVDLVRFDAAPVGKVARATMARVEDSLRQLLDL
ncbi:MAG TPA: type II toxin-antitoxin system PemK/MazF family toxin [Oscillatoriaceae cyanobacterium]